MKLFLTQNSKLDSVSISTIMHNHLRVTRIKLVLYLLPLLRKLLLLTHFLMTFNLEFSKADSQIARFILHLSVHKHNTENPLADHITSLCLL